jgi:hypothetical protein
LKLWDKLLQLQKLWFDLFTLQFQRLKIQSIYP